MILTEVHASGFRCFGEANPLALRLERGITTLVGENDSGKTAVVDAIRLALGTRSEEHLRLSESDFHVGPSARSQALRVRCTLEKLTEEEQSRFLEWCTYTTSGDVVLHVNLRAKRTLRREKTRLTYERRSGLDGDGLPIDGELREYLRVTFLRPLRDAERELRPGRRSRLSEILAALPAMKQQGLSSPRGDHDGSSEETAPTIVDILARADQAIETNEAIKTTQRLVNENYLRALSLGASPVTAALRLGSVSTLRHALERLELLLNTGSALAEDVSHGLGLNNVLFMAAELLLLQYDGEALGLLLVEEPEAHLHPQLQARFMALLKERVTKEGDVQAILTTHSPLLAAGADVESLVLTTGAATYPLRKGETRLANDDYGFLSRFLDATKANLFFARGVLIVEGDGENLLLPTLAECLGRSLTASGVSIVNVGHRGLYRYSRVFQRADNATVPIPIACIADRDIPPDCVRELYGVHSPKRTETDYTNTQLDEREAAHGAHAGGCVKVFVSPTWTLEFDMAESGLAEQLHQAVQLALSPNDDPEAVKDNATKAVQAWTTANESPSQIAARVYEPLHRKRASKAVVAEQLAGILADSKIAPERFRKLVPDYLVSAIDHVTTPSPVVRQSRVNNGH